MAMSFSLLVEQGIATTSAQNSIEFAVDIPAPQRMFPNRLLLPQTFLVARIKPRF